MFRHVVMFRWTPDASAESKAELASGLAEMPAAIDTIRSYRFGPDAGLAEGNWDFVVVADFTDVDGYVVYREHEAHQALIATLIRPIVAERAAVQHLLTD
jgi:hypothetical protein